MWAGGLAMSVGIGVGSGLAVNVDGGAANRRPSCGLDQGVIAVDLEGEGRARWYCYGRGS